MDLMRILHWVTVMAAVTAAAVIAAVGVILQR